MRSERPVQPEEREQAPEQEGPELYTHSSRLPPGQQPSRSQGGNPGLRKNEPPKPAFEERRPEQRQE